MHGERGGLFRDRRRQHLTLVLNLSFSAAFAGNRVIYAAARDAAEANNSGWQSIGSWTVE